MDDKNKGLDELKDLDDFNERYNHYLQSDDENADVEKKEFEDISSFSEGNGDFYSSDKNIVEPAAEETVSDEPVRVVDGGNFFTKNRYHNTKIIALCLVIAILLSAGGFLGWLIWSTKSGGYGDSGIDFHNKDEENYIVDDDHDFEAMGDIDADSLNKYLLEWANNGGEKMYSKNIINVLLCGVDSVYNLCDAQILVSVNKKTEQIKMISFLRDSWTYIKMPQEDGTTYDCYDKMNAAYHGGPATLLTTLENNYKIKIDQYIVVDFKSFPKLIDALGGVTVDVQQYESDYIRRTSKQTDFPVGKVKLNGKQALIYSRIRKCDVDSDLSRTRRQRSVIKGLIESAKTATKGQLVNAFKQVSGYLRTGYTQSEVISLIAQAVSHDWMDFELTEIIVPNEDYVDRIGGYIGSAWCWTVDYPVCAQKIQKEIYGQSNIVLKDDRVSALDYVSNKRIDSYDSGSYTNSNYSGNGYQSYTTSYSYDNDYDYDSDYDSDYDNDYTQPDNGGSDVDVTETPTEAPTEKPEKPTIPIFTKPEKTQAPETPAQDETPAENPASEEE